MVQLASLFFLLFCTVSPKLLLLNNNNSMDMEASPNISPMVPFKSFKSTTLPTKTSSFSTKLNPLQIKSELPIFIEPLPVFSGIGPASVSLMDNPTMVIILACILSILGYILGLILGLLLDTFFPNVLPKDLACCVKDCGLPIQCNSNYAKRSAYQEI